MKNISGFSIMPKLRYLHYNVILMTIGGLYNIKTDNVIKKFFCNLWRFIVFLTLFYLIISNIIDLCMKGLNDFELVIKNYIYLGGGLCVLSRFTYWFIYNEAYVALVKEFPDIIKYKTDTGLREKDIRKYVVFTNMGTLIWLVYVTIAGQCFVLLPLIIQRNSERSLSLPLRFPFDWKISPRYEGVILMQMFIQQVIATMMAAIDMFFATSLILTCAQFQLLGWEFKNVVYKTLLKNNVDLDTVLAFKFQHFDLKPSPQRSQNDLDGAQLTFIRNVISSPKFQSDLLKNLNDLIQFHHSLVEFCRRFDEFFSPSYLMYFGIIIITIVFVEYNLAEIRDVMIISTSFLYLTAALLTLFIPCYLGNLLTSKAEEFLYDLYDTPWFICDENFKTNFKILHQRACKPILFTIGKFGYLTLNAYLGIVRASISYLAVLRQATSDA